MYIVHVHNEIIFYSAMPLCIHLFLFKIIVTILVIIYQRVQLCIIFSLMLVVTDNEKETIIF